MEIHLHNTQSARKELFVPLRPDEVSVYVCGPTVYNLAHIGNGVPAVAFDVLVRLLRVAYPKVKYVRNITDVDDKINAAAVQSGQPIEQLARRFAADYAQDIAALGVEQPDVEPCATAHIDDIIAMIEALVEKGHAYLAQGQVQPGETAKGLQGTHVLFHVPSDAEYGTLAKRTLDQMRDGARVEVAPYKRDPKDFVLWKPSTPDLPGWESPWGRGRPGWHIECSAMIRKHLGPVIDIHGGGSDLTFPHHENESAQSRCANDGVDSVRYWLHNGMLTFGSAKMSKSEGNILTIRELLDRHDGETLRYALLSGHYRQSLAWNDALLAQAKASLDTLYRALRGAPAESFVGAGPDAFPAGVLAALCDDLNTPKALAALHALATDAQCAEDAASKRRRQSQLRAGGWLLGLLGKPAEEHFQGGAADVAEIERQIEERNAARSRRDFAGADAIRDALAKQGIELEDGRDGTRWKRTR